MNQEDYTFKSSQTKVEETLKRPEVKRRKSPVTGLAHLTIIWSADFRNIGLAYLFDRDLNIGRQLLPMLTDHLMSRNHCSFHRKSGGTHILEDHGSTNGTLVNFSMQRKQELKDGDLILIGATLFVYHFGDNTLGAENNPASLLSLCSGKNRKPRTSSGGLQGLKGIPVESKNKLEQVLSRMVESLFGDNQEWDAGLRIWAINLQLFALTYFRFKGWNSAVLDTGCDLPGASPWVADLNNRLKGMSGNDATVLIQGVNGTGKERVARAIYKNSPRDSKHLEIFNCATIDNNLINSELFGYKKGAFSGADSDQEGSIQRAEGGTLFLDEVGEIPRKVQPSLLRFLEYMEIKPLGGITRKVDVRIIAATNQDLKLAVTKGDFREDLYYRLAQIQVEMQPLKNRAEDIWFLFLFFLERGGVKIPLSALYPGDDLADMEQSPALDFLDLMFTYSWPGNVRQLKNLTENLCREWNSTFTEFLPDHGELYLWLYDSVVRYEPGMLRALNNNRFMLHDPVHEDISREAMKDSAYIRVFLTRERLEEILLMHQCNISKVARELNISRPSVYDYIKRHEIDLGQIKTASKNSKDN